MLENFRGLFDVFVTCLTILTIDIEVKFYDRVVTLLNNDHPRALTLHLFFITMVFSFSIKATLISIEIKFKTNFFLLIEIDSEHEINCSIVQSVWCKRENERYAS